MPSVPIDTRGRKGYPVNGVLLPDEYHDKIAYTLILEEELQRRVEEMAAQITEDYCDKDLTAIIMTNGALVFGVDLLRSTRMLPWRLHTVAVRSYSGTESTGKAEIHATYREQDIKDRNVLVIEDIIDTGNSMVRLLPELEKMNPRDLAVTALLDKPSRRKNSTVDTFLRDVGFTIDNVFVVGYGLDFNYDYRWCEDLVVLKPKEYKEAL